MTPRKNNLLLIGSKVDTVAVHLRAAALMEIQHFFSKGHGTHISLDFYVLGTTQKFKYSS